MVAIIFTVLAPDVPGEYKHDYDGYSEHLQEKLVSEQFLLDLRVLLALDKSLTFDSIQILYTDQPTAAPSSIAGSETDAVSSSSSAGMSELSIALVSMAVVFATAIVITAVYYSYRNTEAFKSSFTTSGETELTI